MQQRTCAASSLSEKYQCPEAGRERFDTSPSSQRLPKPRSSRLRASRFSLLTVKISRSGRSLPPVSTIVEDMEGIIAGAADAHKPSQCGPRSEPEIGRASCREREE